jgi:hypothetical protein
MSVHHQGAADQPAPRRRGAAGLAILFILLGLAVAVGIITYFGPGLTAR